MQITEEKLTDSQRLTLGQMVFDTGATINGFTNCLQIFP